MVSFPSLGTDIQIVIAIVMIMITSIFIQKRIGGDIGWVSGIIGIIAIVRIFVPIPFGDQNVGAAISQGFIAGLATVLAVLSYRFSIKSAIHSSLNSLEPFETSEYKIVPTFYEVKWRPRILSYPAAHILNKIEEQEDEVGKGRIRNRLIQTLKNFLWMFRRHTAIVFKVYQKDPMQIADGREFFTSTGRFSVEDFRPASEIYTEEDSPNIDMGHWGGESFLRNVDDKLVATPNLHEYGLHFTYRSTDAREIHELADRVLRQIRKQTNSSDTEK
ncbi:hypothetical protein ACNO8S_13465 [Haloarcula sp. KBTZ06]|uniref:hypothetical protein n=1 Tax=Haloarcula sp. KBTZ06 TaxID=3402682 RepID=UPI003B42D4CD